MFNHIRTPNRRGIGWTTGLPGKERKAHPAGLENPGEKGNAFNAGDHTREYHTVLTSKDIVRL
jgi:hypothetical protein